jgi:hypothetical protein
MPYFLNIINTTAIFIMLLIYFLQNIVHSDNKKNNPKILHYEIAGYIYVAMLASLLNIMNSVNLGDAVFWYGVSLSFGLKSAIFIFVIAGLLIYISAYFSTSSQQEVAVFESLIKDLQENILSIGAKQTEVDEKIIDFTKRFKQIATPEEVDEKIKEMVEDRTDDITEDIQSLTDKMAIIAEQLAKIKGENKNIPAIINHQDENSNERLKKYDWMSDDDEDDEKDEDNDS